ncbi:MAG: hypothetical protein WAM00_11645 [Salegentibacter sp.]
MWARILSIVLGLWLMVAPSIFGYGQAAANNGHIVGPVIVTFSVIAFWEVTRPVRKWNYILAAWLLLAPWILGYDQTAGYLSDMGVAVLVIIFASVKGKIEQKFGGGWSSLWQEHPEHMRENHQN